MSDIYLQITETPTVVTLSAPVISGALSSTVTVANTVTVALDANSLSALENVTVTVGAAITGTVTVSNFPASQAVTFSAVSISNFPASQAVTFSSISVSNFPASQAVTFSDASLTNTQLRASAVTVGGTVTVGNSLTISSLPALAAGTAQIGSVTATIFGIAGAELNIGGSAISALNPVPARIFIGTGSGAAVSAGNPMPVSGSVTASISGTVPVSGTFFQATQPASLASLPALAAGTNQIGSVTASISGTVPISISSVTVGNSVTIGNFPATQAVSLASVPTHGVTLASTTVTVSALPRPTWTNYSGTVTTANTAITAISTTTRSYLLAQVTTGQMFINIGATATSINSVYFSAGQGFAWETSVPQGIVSIISGVTGSNYVLKEG